MTATPPQMVPTRVVPGDNGHIDVLVLNGTTAHVSWSPSHVDTPSITAEVITYEVFSTGGDGDGDGNGGKGDPSKITALLATPEGCKTHGDLIGQLRPQNPGARMAILLVGLSPQTTYAVNIVAQGDQGPLAPYTPTVFDTGAAEDAARRIGKASVTVIVILAVLVFIGAAVTYNTFKNAGLPPSGQALGPSRDMDVINGIGYGGRDDGI